MAPNDKRGILTNTDSNGDWKEYRRMVMSKLEEMRIEIKALKKNIEKLHDDVIMLKVKSGVWGTMGGAIPALIIVILYLVFK